MPHATLEKFGYPAGLIAESEHWAALLRPRQPTLGSLVLIGRSEARAFGGLSAEAYADMGRMVSAAESMLRRVFSYDRINYLMLMMVDPHVHCHVLPRYESPREFAGKTYADPFWPAPADVTSAIDLPGADWQRLLETLRAAWPG